MSRCLAPDCDRPLESGRKECRTHRYRRQKYGDYDARKRTGRPPDPKLAHLTKEQRTRRSSLMQRYRIDLDDFDRILASQGGRCGICGRIAKRWHVDHDHVAGSVRGILCAPCNTALGAFGDNVEGLLQAVEYLRRYEGEK